MTAEWVCEGCDQTIMGYLAWFVGKYAGISRPKDSKPTGSLMGGAGGHEKKAKNSFSWPSSVHLLLGRYIRQTSDSMVLVILLDTK
jgi:hypothetical protein